MSPSIQSLNVKPQNRVQLNNSDEVHARPSAQLSCSAIDFPFLTTARSVEVLTETFHTYNNT
jgi:hypothetical protein